MLAIVPQPRPSSSYSVVVSVAIWHRKFFLEVNLIGEDQSKDLRRVTNRTWECEREGERERERAISVRACGLRERERGGRKKEGEGFVCVGILWLLWRNGWNLEPSEGRERGDDVVADDDDDVEDLAAWRVFASHPPTSTSVSVHSSRVSEQDFWIARLLWRKKVKKRIFFSKSFVRVFNN